MKNGRSKLMGPLARRLGLSVFLISVFATILTSALYLYAELKRDLKNIDTQLIKVGALYLPSIGARLWVADIDAIKLDLGGMLNLQSIEYLAVSEQGEVVVEAGEYPPGKVISHNFPIYYDYGNKQQEIGGLRIVASTNDVYQLFYGKTLSSIFIVALQTFLVAGLVLLLVSRRVTQHLGTISAFARDMSLSNLGQHLVLQRPRQYFKSPDELE